ncbi:hypothetical protein F2P79_004563 [Pimephales promelas]|nr:hypothetical protein F2P79_004563 [Pimephales promelas]
MAFWMKTKQMLEADLLMECEICAERMEVRDQMSMPGQLWTAYTQPVGFWCQPDSPCTPESYIRTCASVCI